MTSKELFEGKTHRYINMNLSIPKMRAQIKIHKEGYLIRPIVNYRSAPAYEIAKYLKNIIEQSNVLKNKYIIKSSTDLTNKLKNIKLTNKSKLISYDFKNVYPSIPLEETMEILKEKLNKTENSKQLGPTAHRNGQDVFRQNVLSQDKTFCLLKKHWGR